MSLNVLVTGATDGIGLLLARHYAALDNSVIATGRRELSESEQSELFGNNGITYIVADQTDPTRAADAIVGCLQSLGWRECDLAILNAGIGWFGDPLTESEGQIDLQLNVNLLGPITLSHALFPFLDSSPSGCLALVGSVSRHGHPNITTYSSTKAGLHGFGRSLREEWRGRIRVVTLHPGPTRTTMHDKAGVRLTDFARRLFLPPTRVANGIVRAIDSGCATRTISYLYVYFLLGGRSL